MLFRSVFIGLGGNFAQATPDSPRTFEALRKCDLTVQISILILMLAMSALLNALLDIYARTEHARTRSIKGYIQLTKMLLYVFSAIIIVATLIDRSPMLLLSGLG